jgi:hypothetical protein
MDDIENSFTSPMKSYKSGTFYIIRTNMTPRLGKITVKIYDESETDIPIEDVSGNMNAVTILEVQGIKCSAKSFQIELEIKQMMVFKSVNLFERCIIKSGEIKKQTEQNSQQIILTDETTVLKKLEEEDDEEKPDQVDEYVLQDASESPETVIDEERGKDLEIVDESYKNESEIKEHLEQEVQQVITKNKNDDIEEVDFGLEQLSSEDTIQIKQRNDVYYEMYREARKKAKIAKDLALSSYLEAKRIKNTYMLNDIVDSDSSDLEELDAEDAEED